jgi:hypothetical protein
MDSRRTAAVVGGLIVVAAGLIFFAHRHKSEITPARPNPLPAAAGLSKATPTPEPVASQAEPTVAAAPTEPPAPSENSAWEDKIDQALRASVNDLQTVQVLIGLLPTFPEEGQIDAADHITNLLTDEQYNIAIPLVTNPKLPETVLGVFMTDLMNRDDPVKLRTLLKVAQIPEHPFREEALADLQIYVDADYETNWPKWNSAVEAYIASHPREE